MIDKWFTFKDKNNIVDMCYGDDIYETILWIVHVWS